MSRLLVFDSDYHSHLWPGFARPLPGGISTRLLDNLRAREQVLEFCKEHRPLARITNGDEFHTPCYTGKLDVPVLNAVVKTESKFQEAGIPCIKNIGNHDQSDRASESDAVSALAKLAIVPTGAVQFVGLKDVTLMLVPYHRDPQVVIQALKEPPRRPGKPVLWFVHHELDGVAVETGWRVKSPLRMSDLPPARVFFGHHHLHRIIPRKRFPIVVIGSPTQQTFTDEGQNKGFLVYDLDTDTFEQIEIKAPRFVTLSWERAKKGLPKNGNFYRVTGAPATAAPELLAAGVIVEAKDEDEENPRSTLQVTVTDLRGAVKKAIKAGLFSRDADPGEVERYSLDVLERCLAGAPTSASEEDDE